MLQGEFHSHDPQFKVGANINLLAEQSLTEMLIFLQREILQFHFKSEWMAKGAIEVRAQTPESQGVSGSHLLLFAFCFH